MSLNVTRRLLVALAILPLIAGMALAAVPATFTCRSDLVTRTVCCCPTSWHAAPASEGGDLDVAAAGCCCDVTQMQAPVTPPEGESRATSDIGTHQYLAPAAPLALVQWSPKFSAGPTARLAHPPPRAVPILLGKQSFLI